MSIIDKALERLEGGGTNVILRHYAANMTTEDRWGTKSLAAMIRKAAEPDDFQFGMEHSAGWCKICGGPTSEHTPDCALIGLCEAVAGEKA